MHASGVLEERVGALVRLARLTERLVHDRGVWTMVAGPYVVEAERAFSDHSVTLRATFPRELRDRLVLLCCDGEPVHAVALDSGGPDVEFVIEPVLPEEVAA